MRIEPIPGVVLRDSPAIHAYLSGSGPIYQRYPYPPFTTAAYGRRAEGLSQRHGADRAALSQALVAYNSAIGADGAALAGARRLAEPGCLAVVTGQQAGACTGPLYTIYKAITTIQLARRQSEQLGVPVVPVFWVASEDHDYAEVTRVSVPGPEGWLHLQLPEGPPGRVSVGHVPTTGRALELVAELDAALPPSDFKAGVVDLLRRTAGAAGNLADWFAQIMAQLFAGTGLVFISPTDPAIRRLQAPFFVRAIEQCPALQTGLEQGLKAWRALGYEPTVGVPAGSTGLFVYVDGQRQPLQGDGSRFWLREAVDISWSKTELMALAQNAPERLSTGVTLRPAVQGWLLPDLAYVGGPGEIAYLGVYREVFVALGQQLPVVFPRQAATLVEPAMARYLEKQGLTLVDVFFRLEAIRAGLIQSADPLGLDDFFATLRTDLLGRYDAAAGQLKTLGDNLGPITDEIRGQITHQVDRLDDKARQQLRKNADVGLRRLDRLGDGLLPGGRLQERQANITYYLAKYGPDLVSRLAADLQLRTDGWEHVAVYL